MTILRAGQPASNLQRRVIDALLRLFLAALLVAPACDAEAASPDPAFSSHVTDLAQVLGIQAVNLDSKLKAFEAATGSQVFVLTVSTTGSRSIDEYAVEVFQKWKVGRANVDDGVLFVIAVTDRQMRIEVGYGLEGRLTDAQCSRIIHDVVRPHFARGQYEAGVEAGVDALLETLGPPPPPVATGASLPVSPAKRGSAPPAAMHPVVAFVGVILAGMAASSLWYGIVGLILFACLALPLSMLLFPTAPGIVLFVAIVSAWICGRWLVVANNVREHHLAGSTNHLLTWLEVLFFSTGSGRPVPPGGRSGFAVKVSFGSSNPGRGGASDEADCGGGGGRSGGGGASGRW